MTHTPTPWHVEPKPIVNESAFDTYAEGSNSSSLSGLILSERGSFIADTHTEGKAGCSKVAAVKDAQFIVTACNAYDANQARIAELEAALANLVSLIDSGADVRSAPAAREQARAALAKGKRTLGGRK